MTSDTVNGIDVINMRKTIEKWTAHAVKARLYDKSKELWILWDYIAGYMECEYYQQMADRARSIVKVIKEKVKNRENKEFCENIMTIIDFRSKNDAIN
jgi:hypothetical protein